MAQTKYQTRFGSLQEYDKGILEIIDDDPKRYTYSNVFEIASNAKPYEKIAVAKNMEYVIECLRAEGTSEWRTAAHDQFALVMDGEVEFRLVKLDEPAVPPDKEGSVALQGEPEGQQMGVVTCRRGHMALLPANATYQMHAEDPGVILMQTMAGDDTRFKWAEICRTM